MKNYDKHFTIKGLFLSFKNAFRGFSVLLRSEYNLYIQLLCAVIATIIGFAFGISAIEWAIQIAVTGLVIFAELVNTAFEKTMDLVHPSQDERVRDIKDLAAATVLFTVIIAVSSAAFIYIPKISPLLNQL